MLAKIILSIGLVSLPMSIVAGVVWIIDVIFEPKEKEK